MKKFYTLLLTILVSLTVFSNSLQPKKLAKTEQAEASVSMYYAAEAPAGVINIIWRADSTLSFAYDVQICLLDTTEYEFTIISDFAYYDYWFAIDGYDGYFSTTSDFVIKYGDNYSDIGDYGADAQTVAEWQAAWETSVNEDDYTLKPGVYVIFVEGFDYDSNDKYITTEKYDYAIVEIEAPITTDVVEIIDNTKKSIKFINPKGQLIIYSNGKYYDVLGNKIQ